MTNLILQLIGLLSAFCGLITISFLLIIYISIKRVGGNLERRHIFVISGVALVFFLGAMALSIIGATI
jgi:hypothetical protein